MSEDEIEVVKGIKENPTQRELMLISIIERLEEELIKTDKVVLLLADRIYKDCKHKYENVDDIIETAYWVAENVEEEE